MNNLSRIHDIFKQATAQLVSEQGFRRVKPARILISRGPVWQVVEVEPWPDRGGGYFRIPWGVGVAGEKALTIGESNTITKQGRRDAESATMSGDLGGALDRGKGFLTVKLPGQRFNLTDLLPRGVRPRTDAEAVDFVHDALDGHLLPILNQTRSIQELASFILNNTDFLARNSIWPDTKRNQAMALATLYTLSGDVELAKEWLNRFLGMPSKWPEYDEPFVRRIRDRLAAGA